MNDIFDPNAICMAHYEVHTRGDVLIRHCRRTVLHSGAHGGESSLSEPQRIWWCEHEGLGWDTEYQPGECVPGVPEDIGLHHRCGWRFLSLE